MLKDRPVGNSICIVWKKFIRALNKKEDRYKFVDAALFVAGLLALIVGILTTFFGKETLAATTLTAGLVLLFASNIERFEFFKALGIETKVMKINEQIGKAEEALEKLKNMTELTAKVLVDVNCRTGRIGFKRTGSGPTSSELVLLESSVREMMGDVGCDQNVIARTLRPLATVLCHDMAEAHLRNLERELSEIERTNLLPAIRDTDNVEEKENLIERMTAVTTFKNARLNQYHNLDIECYPEIFVDMFNGVPELPSEYVAKIKASAERFVPGMIALESGQALSDHQLWVETFDRADKEPLFSLLG